VPPDSIFVLGDNILNSLDSRHFGAVPNALVRGRPLYILASTRSAIGQSLR
jgi:type IV secretory pathway protease TraF